MQKLCKISQDGTQALPELAEQIRIEHAAVVEAACGVLTHALAAGHALIAAKKLVPKGQFGMWISRHCDVGWRQAQRYMRLTEAYEADATRVSHDLSGLSLRGLIASLTPSKRRRQAGETEESPIAPPLNCLSWDNASPAERSAFIGAIGWQTLA